MIISVDKSEYDVSNLEVGKIYRLDVKCIDGIATINKVFVKSINTDKNELVIEALAE